MRPLRWADRQMRIWWPAAAALVGGAVLATLGFVVTTVIDARAQDRLRNDQLAELVEQQAAIIDRNRRLDAEGDSLLQEAISKVEALAAAQFSAHDTNTALKLNDLLHQIAALVGRPAGVPVDPVTAQPFAGPAPAPAPSTAPSRPRSAPTSQAPRPGGGAAAPATSAPATSAPAPAPTTTPDQRSCDKRPSGPRC